MVIADLKAEYLVQMSRKLGRVAQTKQDLEQALGEVQGAQIDSDRLKTRVLGALRWYRQYLLDILSLHISAGTQPGEEVLFALRMYACTLCQDCER